MKDPNSLDMLPTHNVVKLRRGEGDTVQAGPFRLIWKARGEDTGFSFSIFEMPILAGGGVPLHKHIAAEYVTVLEGEVHFARLRQDGSEEMLPCAVGESVTIPCDIPHGMHNPTTQPARVLIVSTYHLEAMFNEVATPVSDDGHVTSSAPDPAVMNRFLQAAAKYQSFLVEPN